MSCIYNVCACHFGGSSRSQASDILVQPVTMFSGLALTKDVGKKNPALSNLWTSLSLAWKVKLVYQKWQHLINQILAINSWTIRTISSDSYQELFLTLAYISSLHCVIDTRYWYQLNPMEKTQCLLYYLPSTKMLADYSSFLFLDCRCLLWNNKLLNWIELRL